METYYVCNSNHVKQEPEIDPNDIVFIEEPCLTYSDSSVKSGPIQLDRDQLQESHKRNCREWSQYETRILMDMYRRNVTQVGPTKKFKSKKEMFMYIAQTISTKLNITRSAHQCENRHKTVVNQRKVTKLRKRKSIVEKRLNTVSAEHNYNEQNSDQSVIKPMNEWGVNDTKLLMELYRKNIPKVGLERTFRTKLKMFEHIANALSDILNINRTAEQCLNRYKTIFRRKTFRPCRINIEDLNINNTNEDNLNSNNNPKCDTHCVNNLCETEFNSHGYDGMTLRKVVRQPKVLSKESDIKQDTALTRTLREIATQKEKTLLKIAANRERAEERRHQETLAFIRELGESIMQCIRNQSDDLTEQH